MDTPRLIRLVRFSFPHKMQRVFDKLKSRAIKKKKAGGNVEDIEINFHFFLFYSMFSRCIEFILLGTKKKQFRIVSRKIVR